MLARIRRELIAEGVIQNENGVSAKKFGWVKQWGYGSSAYFFDFLDPILRKPIVAEFNELMKNVKAFPQADSKIPDPFDYKKLIAKKANLSKQQIKQLKLFTKNYDEAVYEASANLPQIQAAAKAWKWPINRGDPSAFTNVIANYDMNYDGRLSPREMILASIWNNKQTIGSSMCKSCYFEVGKTLDAIFLYLDCNADGLLSAEEIWENLPNVKRKTRKWNMFAFGNDESIRTAAINDFILKNSVSKDGYVTRNEFRVGILLGFWDRQAENSKILSDDGRNLKKFRWQEGDMIDIAMYKYQKNKMAQSGKKGK